MTSTTYSILLCGVGGQGTILAADLLAKTAMASGLDVKVSEVHGMSQRGGSVSTFVRFGEKVHSMVCDKSCADMIISFEICEALRNIEFLKQGGCLFVNDLSIEPMPVLNASASMPANAKNRLIDFGARLIPASKIAINSNSPKSSNVVLLGAMSTQLDFDFKVWETQIAARVPKHTIDANIEAFRNGQNFIKGEI